MARLILKSPYIKSTGGASGYLRYIATRERVSLSRMTVRPHESRSS